MSLRSTPLSSGARKTLASKSPDTRAEALNSSTSFEENLNSTPISFSDLGVCNWLQKAASELTIHKPTSIQKEVLPLVYRGENLIGVSETGSGKTVCYCWPMLERLSADPFGVFGLVLLPSRELAEQVNEQFALYGTPIGLRHTLVVGGEDIIQQSLELSKGPHIIIATPGRLAEHLRNTSAGIHRKLNHLQMLVLDEADALIDRPSIQDDLLVIFNSLPKHNKQILFFTATLSPKLRLIATNQLTTTSTRIEDKGSRMKLVDTTYDSDNPHRVALTPETLQQFYIFLPKHVHYVYLNQLLSNLFGSPKEKSGPSDTLNSTSEGSKLSSYPNETSLDINDSSTTPLTKCSSGIIFTGSCQQCQYTFILLSLLGYSTTCLHGMISQKRRKAALMKFRGGFDQILVATDVASRGLDLPKVDVVINLSFPKTPDVYIHRVGRTARAGRKGLAISFVTQHDVNFVHAAEDALKIELTLYPKIDEAQALKAINRISKAQHKTQLILDETNFQQEFEDRKKRRRTDLLEKQIDNSAH